MKACYVPSSPLGAGNISANKMPCPRGHLCIKRNSLYKLVRACQVRSLTSCVLYVRGIIVFKGTSLFPAPRLIRADAQMFVSSMATLPYPLSHRLRVPPFTFAKWTTRTGVHPDTQFFKCPCPLGGPALKYRIPHPPFPCCRALGTFLFFFKFFK